MAARPRIGIVDYDAGNLSSVANAFEHVGCDAALVRSADVLGDFDKLVLPGVGAYGAGMRHLRDRGFVDALAEAVIDGGKPLLCICLGMQLLSSVGLEHGRHEGLGWIPGEVRRLEETAPEIRIPHFGWNDVRYVGAHQLLDGIPEGSDFYFAHSFHFAPHDPQAAVGVTDHGQDVVAIVASGNVFGVQFHPEKSHRTGLRLIENFARLRC